MRADGRPAPAGRLLARAHLREPLVLAAFLLLTCLMTWPWAAHARDAVNDAGDPYMIAWTLWWDYHATFTDPLALFHANVFFPHPYSLAFSEHDYGIALLFFPLFAAGLRPLTVHSIATLFGFALCGYAAFRLARTVTGSASAGWVAGVFFAFVPYRFSLLSHLHYVFAAWLPLVLEALVLFARERSRRRAAWLAAAFAMNGLTSVTWLILSLAPLAASAGYLFVRYRLARDRAFRLRGAAAALCACLVLLPFTLPYHTAHRLYGFAWPRREAEVNSPTAAAWVEAEQRNRLWGGLGAGLGGGAPLFPGLLVLLLSLAAIRYARPHATRDGETRDDADTGKPPSDAAAAVTHDAEETDEPHDGEGPVAPHIVAETRAAYDSAKTRATRDGAESVAPLDGTSPLDGATPPSPRDGGDAAAPRAWLFALDAVACLAGLIALIAAVYGGADDRPFGTKFFGGPTFDRALFVMLAALAARLCLSYPRRLRAALPYANLLETVRASRRGDAFWLGLVWAACGFLMSLGMNAPLFRFLYDHLLFFRTQRVPARGAMLAYVGLSLLAGAGAARLARRAPRVPARVVTLALCAALLFELRAAPLRFERGAVEPDGVTLRLRETPMRGGVLELPTGRHRGLEHRYTLRAADHARPLINATASFIPPTPNSIERLTSSGPVPDRLLDLLEEIPASYVVVHNDLMQPERRPDYELFLARAVASGRLRFVRGFDAGAAHLYAVVKTEPDARQEEPAPAFAPPRDWEALLAEDPVHLLGTHVEASLAVYRLHALGRGGLPRMDEFLSDMREVARGVPAGHEPAAARLEENLRAFADRWAERQDFARVGDAEFVDALLANAGLPDGPELRAGLIEELRTGRRTRGAVLRRLADDHEFARAQRVRGLVLLHYFGYLRRNPDDPPDDQTLKGFNFWVAEVEKSGDASRLTRGFMGAYEYGGGRR